jgi:hypothetical protein
MSEDAQAVEGTEVEEFDIAQVEKGSAVWFDIMAKLMKTRERAQQSVKRWNDKLAEAEAAIAQLSEAKTPEA